MARYDFTERILAAGLTIDEVEAEAERIARGHVFVPITRDELYGHGRRGEGVVAEAIANLVKQADSLARLASGVTEVSWTNYRGRWVIKGRDLVEGQRATAVRRSGEAQEVWVGKILAVAIDGAQIAEYTTTQPVAQ